jgi:hypothetical protein
MIYKYPPIEPSRERRSRERCYEVKHKVLEFMHQNLTLQETYSVLDDLHSQVRADLRHRQWHKEVR